MTRKDKLQERADTLLRVLRDHPWCDAWQLAGFSGLSKSVTYRVLTELSRKRLVWSPKIHVPDVQGKVYALGREGLIRLSGGPRVAGPYARAFGLDPMSLGQALLRVRALSWGRNLLVSLLAQGQHLSWAISPARLKVGSRSLVLDGHGVVAPYPGRHVTFGLLVDTGGIAVEGWSDKLRLFMLWAEEVGVRPALVILTTYAARAAQFVTLWNDLVTRRGSGATGCLYVGAVSELGTGDARWLTPDGMRRYLWEGMVGDTQGLARPWPEVKLDSSRKLSREEALGSCTLHGALGGNLVLHKFGELWATEWRLLEAIASWPLLRPAELAALMHWQGGHTAHGARRLQELGLVEAKRLAEGRREERLILSPLGIKLLAATHGMRARRFGRARHWPVGRKGPVRLYLGAYEYAVKHTLLTVEFMIGLRRLADWWWDAGYFHRLAIWDSVECVRRYFDARGRRRLIRPDAGGVYQIGRETYPFLLEVDRDRGHSERIVAKFRKYYESRRYPGPLEVGPMPRILILCIGEGRARQINEALIGLTQEFEEPVLDAAITTVERIRLRGRFCEDGTVERVEPVDRGRPVAPSLWPGLREWRLAGEQFGHPTWCFEGLAPSRRHAALRPLDLQALGREVRRESRASQAQRARRRRERARAKGERG